MGCVPSSAVAVSPGGVCLSACWDTTPWEQPPGPGTPQRPVARHAGIPPAMHAGIAPPGDLLQGMLRYHPPLWTGRHL